MGGHTWHFSMLDPLAQFTLILEIFPDGAVFQFFFVHVV